MEYDLAAPDAIAYRGWVSVEVWQEPDQETALGLSTQALRDYQAM